MRTIGSTVRKLARAARKGLLQLLGGVDIEGLVLSIVEVIWRSDIRAHVAEITTIRPASVERYFEDGEMPREFRSEMHFPKRHVYHLRNAIFSPGTGACCIGGYGVAESFGSLRRWALERPIRGMWGVRQRIEATVVCVNTTGYAHYLMEELPRLLWVLRFYEDASLVLPEKVPEFIRDIVSELMSTGALRHPPLRISHHRLQAESYLVTQAESHSGFWHESDLGLLRESFLHLSSGLAPCAIYVSRRGSSRSLQNEQELEMCLARSGVEVVRLEELSVRAQVELFSAARTVVAPHGAGLVNLVWCQPGTRVVEIFSHRCFNDCFARLARQMDCDYAYLWASEEGQGWAVSIEKVVDAVHGSTRSGGADCASPVGSLDY